MEVKPGYKQTEIGVIPEDWVVSTLGESAKVITGRTPPTNDPSNYGHEHPFVGPADLGSNKYIVKSEKYLSQKGFNKAVHIPKNSILVTCIGSTIGKVGISGLLLSTNQQINSLIPAPTYDMEYLYYTVLNNAADIKMAASEQAVPIINKSSFSRVKAAFAPIKEQQEIVIPLKEIDSLITSLEKLVEKKKQIKQGVMQELLTGKKRLPGFTGEWETKTYGDVFQFLNTANYSRDALINNGEIRYIHYGDIHTKFDGYLDIINSNLPCIRKEQIKSYAQVKNGDVIMADASEDYSGIGKSVEVINDCDIKAIAGLHTFLLRDTEQVFVDGYRAYISAIESVKKQFDFLATGMKVFGVSKNNLKKVVIPVPPKDEQKVIVNVIGNIANEISSYEIQLSKYRLLKQAMMQELLTGRIRLI
jgi:type I restriction enzyme S subunit